MCEMETYYSSLSETKWFTGIFSSQGCTDTWQINSSQHQNPAQWEASVSEDKPAYDAPFFFTKKPVAVFRLN